MNVVGAKERELDCALVSHTLSLYGIGARSTYGAMACETLILGWGVLQSELGGYKRKLRVCRAMDGERLVLNNMLVGEVIALFGKGVKSPDSSLATGWRRMQGHLVQVQIESIER